MATGFLHTHLLSVILFVLIYLVKTILLLANKEKQLATFSKMVKVPEMIISTLFLLTGIYLLTQIPEIKTLLIIKIVLVLAAIPIAIVGFRKKNKLLAVISFLLIIIAYGLAEMSKKQKSKAMETITEATMDAKQIYEASCISCHGNDGKLMLMNAKDLSLSTMELDARIGIIKMGKGNMTPFGTMLNDSQIKAVAEYVGTLKK